MNYLRYHNHDNELLKFPEVLPVLTGQMYIRYILYSIHSVRNIYNDILSNPPADLSYGICHRVTKCINSHTSEPSGAEYDRIWQDMTQYDHFRYRSGIFRNNLLHHSNSNQPLQNINRLFKADRQKIS